MMSFKIPCGGFKLDEKSFSLDVNGVLSVSGGSGGGVPKPLTYDYMPDGYPTKSVQTTTLMEEQQVAFTLNEKHSLYMAQLTNAFDVVKGQKYTVNWDGTEYECVGIVMGPESALGNTSVAGEGSDTGEPFMYVYNARQHSGMFATLDTAASHTISIKGIEETVTPMATEFLPSEVDELIMNSSTPGSAKKFKITVDDSGTLKATEI